MSKYFKFSLNLIAIIGFIFLCQLQTSCNQSQPQTKAEKIDNLISLYADYEGFNGAVLVSHKNEVIYKKGFGYANMEWEIPNQVDTKFRIASITKPFTAMLIMQLVSEKKLELHKPISTYLPNYPKINGSQITIHQLLTHTSGIPNNYNSESKLERFPDKQKPEKLVDEFSGLPLEFIPGERFSYCNAGYVLLGYLIESVTNKSFETVLKEKILEPLGMKNTSIDKHRPLIKQRASGYFKAFGDYYNSNYIDMSSVYAAGAIYSTVEDLFIWNQALSEETLLPKQYLDLMFTKHIEDSHYGGHYGYGWELIEKSIGNTNQKIETISHDGSIDGFCALFTSIPSSQSSIIFLNNTKRAFLNAMTTAITGILNDQPYDFPLKPTAKFMSDIIKNKGIESGIAFYKKYKDDPEYHSSEQELIVAGYKLLHAGNTKDAAQVFKLSTEVFPDRDNPYDSYAEALMALGKNNDAIINYKKSLELNPKNTNAIKMLEKLGVDGTKVNDIFKTDTTWGKEIFKMPLHFAKNIDLYGIEDARFPKGWNDTKSPNFWSYAFAWKVNLNAKLSKNQLEDYIVKYYDGLIKDVNKNKSLTLPPTKANLKKINDSKYVGNVTIFDAFVTNRPLNLNVITEQLIESTQEKLIVTFKISPSTLDKVIWKELDRIEIKK